MEMFNTTKEEIAALSGQEAESGGIIILRLTRYKLFIIYPNNGLINHYLAY